MLGSRFILRESRSELLDTIDFSAFSLNETGVFILKRYLSCKQDTTVAAELAASCGVPYTTAFEDTTDFLKSLTDSGIALDEISIFDEHRIDSRRRSVISTPIIHIIQNCNSPCVMCDCWKTKGRVQLSFDEIAGAVDAFADQGADAIMVSGGEPLLHPQLVEVLKYIKQKGLRIELNTNAWLLSKRDELFSLNIERIVISIDGFDHETYAEIRGKDRLTNVVANIKAFQSASPKTKFGFRTTVTKHTLSEAGMAGIFALARSLDVEAVGFSPLDIDSSSFNRTDGLQNGALLAKALLPTLAQLDAYIDAFDDSPQCKILRDAFDKGLSIWDTEKFKNCLNHYRHVLNNAQSSLDTGREPCLFPFTSTLVDYNGDVRACFYSAAMGSVKDIANVDWSGHDVLEQLRNKGTCVGCRGKVFCS